MRTHHIITLALLMSLTATTVFARGQERPGADKRHCQENLRINAEKLKANFQALDANHDGLLTEKESGLKNLSRMCFDRLDHEGDHKLSITELNLP